LLVILASTASAQQSMVGYSSSNAQRERDLEASATKRPSPSSAAEHSKQLSRETHVAGTPAQARTRDYVIDQMKKWGIETDVRSYDVWMPHPVSVRVARQSPQPKEFSLAEPPVAGDPTSSLAQYPTVNGYSGQGDVTAEVVYVNYGLIEDYAQLDSMGVSVKGKIAIARYGRSFRGIKAREAEKHGAVALLIYSDPQDDGFVVGDVYPDGPMRNSAGVQRGSILNVDGDPSTPGYGSKAGVTRLTADKMEISHIPVVPIGYGNAGELLKYVRGASVPRSWQGGLSFHYHAGPGPVRAVSTTRSTIATRG
jgi:N-acetylated-alpha-linked acidic dipeptidase